MILTVVCPGIRTQNWQKLYRSILKAYPKASFGDFEIIFVGPYPLPEILRGFKHIRYIQDWGSPVRSQQIGLVNAYGDWITWAADDGEYLPYTLDVAMAKLGYYDFDPTKIIMGKYFEGDGNTSSMGKNDYYVLSNHDASRSKWLPKEYLMLNCGIVSRRLLFDLGGWDCGFEVCPMAYNDFAIRAQNYGAKFIIQDEIMFKYSHMPGHSGDHGPIHDAQILKDQPLFKNIYSQNECTGRTKIDINNWKHCPERWERRFGKEGNLKS